MNIDITSAVDGEILLVELSGRLTDANVQDFVRRYFDMALGSGLKKILIDLRPLSGRLPLGTTYFLIRDLPAAVPSDVSTAFVEKREHRDSAEFLEVALRNLGVHIRHFFDYQEALTWLRSL